MYKQIISSLGKKIHEVPDSKFVCVRKIIIETIKMWNTSDSTSHAARLTVLQLSQLRFLRATEKCSQEVGLIVRELWHQHFLNVLTGN